MDKRKLRHDIILIAVCLFVSLALWLAVTLLKKPGETVVVTVNGEEYARYSLDEDREVVIETERGRNVLVIKDGYADIVDATCPDGLCERQRRIDESGESLVCLPNKVTVTVIGGNGVDFVG
ncbi:MAG: NusG domain II-containing protein [Ruminococcaceae bacterium]|nr:NusG domain II-containing protein [Oscillospiraceae bacterium]